VFVVDDFKKFARYFRQYKLQLAIGIACILASTAFGLFIPFFVGKAIDANWTEVSWTRLTISAGKVLAASIISGTFLFLQRRILIGISRNVEYDMRKEFYEHLVGQPLSFFHDHRTGDLMARATSDLSAVRQLAGPMIMYTLQTVFVVILVLPLMFILNWWLTLLLFVTMPLVSLTVKYFGQQVHARFEKIQEFFADIMARQGLYPDGPSKPCVMGYEVAGVVESVGEGVDQSIVGVPVVAMTRFRGQSEKVVVAERQLFEKPESLSFEQAAAIPVNYLTAYALLVAMGGLRAKESVLIHNAGGGVGLAALDIAKKIGATTYGTASP